MGVSVPANDEVTGGRCKGNVLPIELGVGLVLVLYHFFMIGTAIRPYRPILRSLYMTEFPMRDPTTPELPNTYSYSNTIPSFWDSYCLRQSNQNCENIGSARVAQVFSGIRVRTPRECVYGGSGTLPGASGVPGGQKDRSLEV